MDNQINKAMPAGTGSQEQSQAQGVVADYIGADALRGALGSMMEMVYAQAGGMMMPPSGSAKTPAPSNQQMGAANQANKGNTQATAATAPGNAEVLFEACSMA